MPIQIGSFNSPPFSQNPGSDHSQREAQDIIIGIDLGTTNSLVAAVDSDGVPYVIRSESGESLVPSVVTLLDGQLVIGSSAKKNKIIQPSETVFSVKRLMGKGPEDLSQLASQLPYEILAQEGSLEVKLAGQQFSPVEISSLLLKKLKERAEEHLGKQVTRAVITVPAYFNDAQRQATRAAGKLAGLQVLRIINEPTAASLAYGLDKKKQGLIAVYDLGGGTFDISILKLQEGIFEVLATRGDTQLGGDDLDQAMARLWLHEIQEQNGVKLIDSKHAWALVLEACERAKIELSSEEQAEVHFSTDGKTYQRNWNRSDLKILAAPLLEKTRQCSLAALSDAQVQASELSDVILVGGPTRLPLVREFVFEVFGKAPSTEVNPDEAVALGAAIQADVLSGRNREVLLLDVVPLSLGLETYGGLMASLIPRNTRIPAVAQETFTTFVDNQTGVDIHVLQGERERAEENRSLARFRLKGIEPLPAGFPRIEVSFLIDADGILQVTAKDLRTRKEQSIDVKPSFGLTDEQVEKMLFDRLEHQQEDLEYRQLAEARTQAEGVIRAVKKGLPQAQSLVSPSELQDIEKALLSLETKVKESDHAAIEAATRELNRITENLAGAIIKETIKKRSTQS